MFHFFKIILIANLKEIGSYNFITKSNFQALGNQIIKKINSNSNRRNKDQQKFQFLFTVNTDFTMHELGIEKYIVFYALRAFAIFISNFIYNYQM